MQLAVAHYVESEMFRGRIGRSDICAHAEYATVRELEVEAYVGLGQGMAEWRYDLIWRAAKDSDLLPQSLDCHIAIPAGPHRLALLLLAVAIRRFPQLAGARIHPAPLSRIRQGGGLW